MWFKNIQLYQLTAPWKISSQNLESALAQHNFQVDSAQGTLHQEWVSPLDNDQFVHSFHGQFLLNFCVEKKLLPNAVINQFARERALEFEAQHGFRLGRKKLREMKEQIKDELLPRAFSLRRTTQVWIDTKNGWVAIDAANTSKADEIVKFLFRSLGTLPLASFRTQRSPQEAMTNWLMADEKPAHFSIDQDAELCAVGESRATVRYVRHTLEDSEIRHHISSGKQCIRLAMTWADKISFVLTDTLTLKRLTPLDILKEEVAQNSSTEEERKLSDMTLMCAELNLMLSDLAQVLGGIVR